MTKMTVFVLNSAFILISFQQFELEDFYNEVVSSVTDLGVWKFLIGYFVLVAIVYALPAPTHDGPPVATSGKILKYKVSGWSIEYCG